MLLPMISLLLLPSLIGAHAAQDVGAELSPNVPAAAPSLPSGFVAISTLLTLSSTTVPEAAIELREVVAPNGQPANAAPGAVPAANGAAPAANQPAPVPANGAAPAPNQPAAVPAANPAANGAPVGGAAAGGAAAPAGAPGGPTFTQASPVTTIFEPTTINGVTTDVAVVYSQKFPSVPNQGPTPAAGSIGMGTLTGTVGAVKTQSASGATAGCEGTDRIWVLALCSLGILLMM
ncbi:MAG: hypothetical protein M1836_003768 [Candelina mexicana]|nr:MAG: hypothetical protein M1836_003768 [Candelina mexicana]